jgi:beta-aspartyl-peptidase (threonine type)
MKEQEGNGKKANDTVGCVALDSDGNIAAGASTGGLGNHPRGRVGDTPQVGCGIFADNQIGGCSNTGDGEAITRVVLAYHAVTLVESGSSPQAAANKAMQRLGAKGGGDGGSILIDVRGRIGWAHNSTHMAVGYRTEESRGAQAFVQKSEESIREAAA